MRRLSVVLLTLFAFACAGVAQRSSSGTTVTEVPAAPPASSTMSPSGSQAGAATTTTTAPATTGTLTPLAPGTTTTVNPGDPQTPTGSPLVPGSSVPTETSNQQLNTFTGTTATGVGTNGGVGQVAPSFHLETELPAPGVTSNGTGAPAGVTNEGVPGNSSPTTGSVAVYNVAGRGANPSDNAAGGPEIVDMGGMTFVNGNPPQQATDTRSLGEIAAQYKRQRSVQAAHVYTNEDIDRLNARNDANVMGPNQNAVLPQGEGVSPQPQRPAVKKSQKRSPFTPRTNEPPQ